MAASTTDTAGSVGPTAADVAAALSTLRSACRVAAADPTELAAMEQRLCAVEALVGSAALQGLTRDDDTLVQVWLPAPVEPVMVNPNRTMTRVTLGKTAGSLHDAFNGSRFSIIMHLSGYASTVAEFAIFCGVLKPSPLVEW
jgi:hypothetical protein